MDIGLVARSVSIYRTGKRIGRMQDRAGTRTRVVPVLGLIGSFVWVLDIPYYQSAPNEVWDMAARGSAPSQGTVAAAAAAPQAPPPPPQGLPEVPPRG